MLLRERMRRTVRDEFNERYVAVDDMYDLRAYPPDHTPQGYPTATLDVDDETRVTVYGRPPSSGWWAPVRDKLVAELQRADRYAGALSDTTAAQLAASEFSDDELDEMAHWMGVDLQRLWRIAKCHRLVEYAAAIEERVVSAETTGAVVDYSEKRVDYAGTSVRLAGMLERAHLHTLGEIVACGEDGLRRRRMGRKSINEVVEILYEHGLSLPAHGAGTPPVLTAPSGATFIVVERRVTRVSSRAALTEADLRFMLTALGAE